MKAAAFFLTIIMIMGVQSVSADFYKYVDRHGNVLYTDDINKVPADLRTTARPYEESSSTELAQDDRSENKSDPLPAAPTGDALKELEGERKQLEQQKMDLNKEYEELTKKRNELDEEKKITVTQDQIKNYNQKIVDFNARIKDYEKKRDLHTEKVNAFNSRLKESTH